MGSILSSFDENFLGTLIPFLHMAFKYHRYEVVGLENVPLTGPVIMVVNHSFATYDGILLGASLHLQTGRSPCGLADNNLFRTSFLKNLSHKMRLVEANHENAEKLLADGELLMIAPGGMREALRPTSTESFKVRWQNRMGFAKLAVKTQCPVILAACPAADKIYEIYPNYFTKLFYKKFKLPLVVAKGLGPTLIPRPVKLTHYLSRPLHPPGVNNSPDSQEEILSFHQTLVQEMERLMNLERNRAQDREGNQKVLAMP